MEPFPTDGLPSRPVAPMWVASPTSWMASSVIDRALYPSRRSSSRSGHDGTSLMAVTHDGGGTRERSEDTEGVRLEPGRGEGGENKKCRAARSRPSDARGNGWNGWSVLTWTGANRDGTTPDPLFLRGRVDVFCGGVSSQPVGAKPRRTEKNGGTKRVFGIGATVPTRTAS